MGDVEERLELPDDCAVGTQGVLNRVERIVRNSTRGAPLGERAAGEGENGKDGGGKHDSECKIAVETVARVKLILERE